LEQAYAAWALRQTASGGLSLVLPPASLFEDDGEEGEQEEEDDGHGLGLDMEDGEEHEQEQHQEQQHGIIEEGKLEDGSSQQQQQQQHFHDAVAEQGHDDGTAPPLGSLSHHHHGHGDDYHPREGKTLEAAIDEIQTYMTRRASRAWSRSACLAEAATAAAAASAAVSAAGGGRSTPSPLPLPLEKRAIGAGALPLPPGVEGGPPRDSLALRASLLAAAGGRPPSKMALARQRWLWAVGDYALSLLVFVMLSVTWWRGAWNLYDFYVFPDHRGWRIVTLVACGATVNVLAFLAYGPIRAWGRRIRSPRAMWAYGAVKRLAVLVRMLASVANWTGVWDLFDSAVRAYMPCLCAYGFNDSLSSRVLPSLPYLYPSLPLPP
jgi:hypothetical protein